MGVRPVLVTALCAVTFIPISRLTAFQKAAFEVASIKPGDPNDIHSGYHTQSGGRFSSENVTLKTLVLFAYSVDNYQLVGGPAGVDDARFTIDARPAASSITERDRDAQVKMMVQSLLADRFKLSIHSETRDAPVYEMVIAKGGHKLKPQRSDARGSNLTIRQGRLIGDNVPIAQLVHSLSLQFGRTVIDRTGLTGKYDFEVAYTPEARDGLFGEPLPPVASANADPDHVSIFTALQEHLGLRLESARGSVDVIVIDHAEKPDAN